MVNTLRKGNALEKAVAGILEGWGYKTYRPPRARFSRKMEHGGNDAFGVDILAKKAALPWRLVQVGTSTNLSHKERQVEEGMTGILTLPEMGLTTNVEVWIWGEWKREKRVGFQIYRWNGKEKDWWKSVFVSKTGETVV